MFAPFLRLWDPPNFGELVWVETPWEKDIISNSRPNFRAETHQPSDFGIATLVFRPFEMDASLKRTARRRTPGRWRRSDALGLHASKTRLPKVANGFQDMEPQKVGSGRQPRSKIVLLRMLFERSPSPAF